jgi:hypothetical protein
MTESFAQQIDHDGLQHIDGAAPPASRSEGPVFRDGGEAHVPLGVSKAMPPQDVMDAAMMLTEACSAWTPAPLPKLDANGNPAAPMTHNPSYVMHQDLCSLATNPVGFNTKVNDTFSDGMVAALALLIAAYVLIKGGLALYRYSARKNKRQSGAEALKARLIVEAAKTKIDEIKRRQAPGAAQ